MQKKTSISTPHVRGMQRNSSMELAVQTAAELNKRMRWSSHSTATNNGGPNVIRKKLTRKSLRTRQLKNGIEKMSNSKRSVNFRNARVKLGNSIDSVLEIELTTWSAESAPLNVRVAFDHVVRESAFRPCHRVLRQGGQSCPVELFA